MGTVKTLGQDLKKIIEKEKDLRYLTKSDLAEIGRIVIKETVQKANKGISPLTGKRFPAYINPTNYPDKVKKKFPTKRRRPVNLHLSGDFLSSLIFEARPGSKPSIRFTFSDNLSKLKEKGHREGAGGQPKRPIMPDRNETWSKDIVLQITKALVGAVLRRKRR